MLSSQLFICKVRLKMLCCERGETNSIYEIYFSASNTAKHQLCRLLVSSETKNAVDSGYPGGRWGKFSAVFSWGNELHLKDYLFVHFLNLPPLEMWKNYVYFWAKKEVVYGWQQCIKVTFLCELTKGLMFSNKHNKF